MLLEFDLGGADWFCTAFYAHEPNMIAVFRSGKSPHPITGSRLSGVPEEIVTAENKAIGDLTDPLEIEALRRERFPEILKARWAPRTMSIRQGAKKANHGLNYRESFKTYALTNEISESEAKQIIHLYRDIAYPGLPKWYEWIDKTVRDTRTLTNCFQRKVYFSGSLDDDTFRQATAFVPQSTVFDITARAMPLMLNDGSADFAPAQLLAQVHDSLLTDYRSRDFAAMARFAIKLGLDYMSPVLDYGEPFTLGVGLKAGLAWGKSKEIKLVPDEGVMARELEQAWCEANEARLKKAA